MATTSMAAGYHRDLLDIIDKLRSQGVSHYVGLPEIIVCGDQATGKSSVLEAISGMPFPTKDGLCTRFATELVLRRSHEEKTKVSIIPGENRIGEDKERLERWEAEASIDKEGLGAVTNEAKRAMADGPGAGEFYEDILRIELTGPQQPHLTMVDLPGMFRTGNKEQSTDDVVIVCNMVKRYMARPRSIILAVVSAKSEYVLQEVTSMAKTADPEGMRTMGLITKPDTLDVGSESEGYFVRLAQNQEEELRLGWHVLKNRNFEERNVTSAERDAIETKFFSQGLWCSIDSSHCGVAALRVRLSDVLIDQILAQLPSLVRDVSDGIQDCTSRLDRLGPVRGTPQQQLSYLLRVSEDYTSLVTQAVEGTYTDRFFGSRKKIDQYSTRLRAVVHNQLLDFRDEMLLNGQTQYLIDSETEDEGDGQVRDSPRVSRSKYVEGVAHRLKFSKGRELPGLFNPLIVSELFLEQCEPWGKIAGLLAENIVEATELTTRMIIMHVAAREVADGVFEVVRQGIEGLRVELDAQVKTLLASATQHPITYNTQLIENVNSTQEARRKRHFRKLVGNMFGEHRFDHPENKLSVNPIQLMDMLVKVPERDMERFGSSLAVDYMEAYYKVAVSRFIDDVSALAIEDCLISRLSTLFKSSNVAHMSAEDLSRLAGETPETSLERTRLEAKRGILETGLQDLKSFRRQRIVVHRPQKDHVLSNGSEQASAMTSSPSGKASIAPTIVDAPPRAVSPGVPSPGSPSQDRVAMSPPDDEWFLGDTDAPRTTEKSTNVFKEAMAWPSPYEAI